MNDDLEVLRRLVDYHDHIAAPPVAVADDLRRGRRRVRRRRAVVAGTLAAGLASAVAAVTLVIGAEPGGRPEPAGPPSPPASTDSRRGSPGLVAPLIAPDSMLDVRELGFRVEGLQTVGGRLLADRQEVEVVVERATYSVEVYYQGRDPELSASDPSGQEIRVHGVAGTLVERPDFGSHLTYLIWEYAPDSWAVVRRSEDSSVPSRKAEVLVVAEAVRPGGPAVRVPFRLGTASAPLLRSETLVEVWMSRDAASWRASYESGLGLVGNPSTSGGRCGGSAMASRSERSFSHRGHTGCVEAVDEDLSEVGSVELQVDGQTREVHRHGAPLTGYRVEDLADLLAGITVASSDDRATWFDLATAFGG